MERARVLEVHEVDAEARRRDDQELRLRVERVDALVAIQRRGRGARLPHVPELDRLVPRPRDHDRPVRPRDIYEAHAAHGGVVGADDHLLCRGQVDGVDLFIGPSCGHHGPVLCDFSHVSYLVREALSTDIPSIERAGDTGSCSTCRRRIRAEGS